MVGGGNRRDEGSLMINNTNVFAALGKKKKSDKDRGSSKSKGSSNSKSKSKESEPQVFWAPAPLTVKSWADVDDEDDDDYYATTAPPQSAWGLSESQETKDNQAHVEESESESESEEDILDEGDEEADEEHDQELEVPVQHEPVVTKAPEVSSAPKEAERQLSKKEKKKKELAELEALLADFGVSPNVDNAQDESRDVKEKKDGETNGVGAAEKNENVPPESKSARKKKKKDKSSKEVKELQDQANSSDVTNGLEETAGTKQGGEEDASAVDVKERLKKIAAAKKKKSNKELDGAAKAAATEAAARSARLAAAKKKEKNHYNQQPAR